MFKLSDKLGAGSFQSCSEQSKNALYPSSNQPIPLCSSLSRGQLSIRMGPKNHESIRSDFSFSPRDGIEISVAQDAMEIIYEKNNV